MSVYENAAGECEGDGSDYGYLQCREGAYAGEYGAFDVLDVGWTDGRTDACGRGYRSGQGLRRGILLGLRELAKIIAAEPELAVGSDS